MSKTVKSSGTKEEAKPTLLPKLRFPDFREADGWRFVPLDSVCDVLNSRRRPISSNERTPGPYPYYGASGIVDYVGDFIFDERLLLVGEDGAKWGAFESTAFIADGKYWVNNHAHVLKPFGASDTLLENYLTMQDLSPFVTGAAPPKLTLGKLKTIPVPLPPKIAEQQKIAECLSSVDELIAAQARKVDALKTHKKGLMQQLFPREGETQPRLRFPEFQDAGEWGETTIGDLKPFVTSGSRGWAPFYAEQGELFVRITNMWRDFIYLDLTDSKYVQLPPGANEGIRTQLKEHDVLISITADIGIISYVDESIPSPAYINQHIALVRFDEGQLSGKYVAYFLASERSQQLFRASTDTGTKAGMSLIGIQKIGLILPSRLEQQRIADCLSSLDALIAAATQKLDALKLHKRGLMQQLFPSPEEVQV